jgi:hypothetical protein
MAGRSLGPRLGLAINVLLVTGLSLGLDYPPLDVPGEPEEGRPSSWWCRKCHNKLRRKVMPSGIILSCPLHGAIDDDDILTDPPPSEL